MKRITLMILGWLTLNCSVQAASFDCAKAQKQIERLICANAELSNLDEDLDAVYREAQSRAINVRALKKAQLTWVNARNLCPDALCVQDAYAKRLSALRFDASDGDNPSPALLMPVIPALGKRVVEPPQPRDLSMPCLSSEECQRNPVRTETLGENWQYQRDIDKLPVIRNALASGKLKPQTDFKDAVLCSAFKDDLLNGRTVQVVEPDYQVLSVDDPRFGRWMAPMSCPDNDDVAPYTRFLSLDLYGIPPYRFYRHELDGNKRNGWEDVVLYREAGNGYGQRYDWVDLKQCVIRRTHQVSSPQGSLGMDHRDALGLLIVYRGILMTLEYTDYAKRSEIETNGSRVWLAEFLHPQLHCGWEEPVRPTKE